MSYDLEKLTAPLSVAQRIPETSDAVSLVFSIPKEREKEFRFGPGQFLTLFLNVNGETLPRSYSICSSPAVDRELKITIKRVSGGKGSNYIMDQVRVGDVIRVSPPAGHFFRPPASAGPHHWLLAAAGSGITPIFSILKTVLLTEPKAKVTLLFANRSPELVIYAKEIELWQSRHSERLKVVHVMSKPPLSWAGVKGRCEGDLLERLLSENLNGPEQVEAYLCGPDQFMNNVRQSLVTRGFKPEQIHMESFTIAHPGQGHVEPPPATAGDGPATRVYIGSAGERKVGGEARLEVLLGGENLMLTLKPNQTVLEALMESGSSPPYSCLEGNCMACMAKVREGTVYQDDPGILVEDNMKAGETLTCQARSASAKILIDYDSL